MKPDATAVDIAVLPPRDVSQRAIALSADLPAGESQGLLLGPNHVPHITLTQQFVQVEALARFIEQVDGVLRSEEPLRLRVTGGGKGSSSVWMAVERTPALIALHERLLHATGTLVADGDASAFLDGDARDRDVRWVREFRRESSFDRFTPHITLGHASEAPLVEPMDFVAARIAVCRLGRFCTCTRIIREWELRPV